MKVKDMDGCEDCPLLGDYCKGGVQGTPNGYIEPPCFDWDDAIMGMDTDELLEKISGEEAAYQDHIRAMWEKEEKEEIKKKEKLRRAKESRLHVRHETRLINNLRKRISSLRYLKSFSSAVSIAKEMMGEVQAQSNTPKIDKEIELLNEKIKELTEIKKAKLKELRSKRKG